MHCVEPVASGDVGKAGDEHGRASDFVGLYRPLEAFSDSATRRAKRRKIVLDQRRPLGAADTGEVACQLLFAAGQDFTMDGADDPQGDSVASRAKLEISGEFCRDAVGCEIVGQCAQDAAMHR